MEYTGERMIVKEGHGNVEEHLRVLEVALPYCVGKSVLDAACGDGHACESIKPIAKEYFGIDLSAEAIKYCWTHYPGVFIQMDICSIDPSFTEKFDTVISIETFEHVPELQVEKMVQEVHRVLKPDGIYFFSTPCGDALPYRPTCPEEVVGWHFRHYRASELRDLLDPYFKSILIGKINKDSSLIVVAQKK